MNFSDEDLRNRKEQLAGYPTTDNMFLEVPMNELRAIFDRLELAEKAIPHLMEHGAIMCNRCLDRVNSWRKTRTNTILGVAFTTDPNVPYGEWRLTKRP